MPNFEEEYRRLNSPEYAQGEIANRMRLLNPALRRQLAGIRSNLNQRGLFSSSPVTRSSNQAVSSLTNQVGTDVYGGLEQRRFQLLQLIEQKRQEEARRRQSSRFGLGSLLATGLSFIPGIGGAASGAFNALRGSGGGSNQSPTFNPQLTPNDYNNYPY